MEKFRCQSPVQIALICPLRPIPTDACKILIEGLDAWEGMRSVEVSYVRRNRMKETVQVVRCKDCKHRPVWEKNHIVFPDDVCPCQCIDDDYYNWMPVDNWFCANGETE